ncbi:KATNB1-like protein 1 [Actinia tenebrosa]|uniref:KATNB1-like protein 1 n=1 Tax=Actinia tenebrosa TaxID=6105 RepID=A0A6P8J788_ACTTE|nr:KATNB1-like protein 1 [Actinia tenebrosa]
MASLKKRSASVDNVGHFYYDWALSRYKWTSEEIRNKQNNHSIQENGLSNENGEIRGKKHIDQVQPVGIENLIPLRMNLDDNVKRPLRNRDVNQPIPEERVPIKPVLEQKETTDVKEDGALRKKSVSNEPKDEALELMNSHPAMMSVLTNRLLRLRAAETLWHKDTNAFLEYVLRLKDDALLVDVMPLLTSRVKENAPEGQALSMGACLEMLPALERLLASKFEDYIVVALNMVREMIKRWWTQLKAATSEGNDPKHQRCSRSVNGLYMAMVSISAIIARLKSRKGRVAEKALIVSRLLDLL